jgi:hypothetical protein
MARPFLGNLFPASSENTPIAHALETEIRRSDLICASRECITPIIPLATT